MCCVGPGGCLPEGSSRRQVPGASHKANALCTGLSACLASDMEVYTFFTALKVVCKCSDKMQCYTLCESQRQPIVESHVSCHFSAGLHSRASRSMQRPGGGWSQTTARCHAPWADPWQYAECHPVITSCTMHCHIPMQFRPVNVAPSYNCCVLMITGSKFETYRRIPTRNRVLSGCGIAGAPGCEGCAAGRPVVAAAGQGGPGGGPVRLGGRLPAGGRSGAAR